MTTVEMIKAIGMEDTMEKFALATIEEKTDVEIFTGDYLDKQTALGRELLKSFMPDVSTQKGRDAIKTFSVQYRTVKVRVDVAGKNLGSELRDKLSKINFARNSFNVDWQAMQDEAREPLTEWEADEKARVAAEKLAAEIVLAHDEALTENAIVDRELELARKEAELAAIEEEKRQKADDERFKLERLEREEAIRKEATEKAEREAVEAIEAAKRERLAAEQAVIDAIEEAQKEKIETEKRAEYERYKAEQEKEAAIIAERKRIEEIAETERQETLKRGRDTAHKAKVNNAVIDALVTLDISKTIAKKIVIALCKHEIPHTKINY